MPKAVLQMKRQVFREPGGYIRSSALPGSRLEEAGIGGGLRF
jgi:hypothetical protein